MEAKNTHTRLPVWNLISQRRLHFVFPCVPENCRGEKPALAALNRSSPVAISFLLVKTTRKLRDQHRLFFQQAFKNLRIFVFSKWMSLGKPFVLFWKQQMNRKCASFSVLLFSYENLEVRNSNAAFLSILRSFSLQRYVRAICHRPSAQTRSGTECAIWIATQSGISTTGLTAAVSFQCARKLTGITASADLQMEFVTSRAITKLVCGTAGTASRNPSSSPTIHWCCIWQTGSRVPPMWLTSRSSAGHCPNFSGPLSESCRMKLRTI